MSNRVSRRALKSAAAIAGIMVGGLALSGCASVGRTFGDGTVTGSAGQSSPTNLNQPMPGSLGAPNMQVAESQFLPPANVGGFGAPQQGYAQPAYTQPMGGVTSPIQGGGGMQAVSSQDLPVLNSSSPMGNQQAMPAQQNLAPVAAMPMPAALGAPAPIGTPAAHLAAIPANAYTHTIASGESLYTIARRYDVTTQAIVQANNLGSPDKIVVGQRVIIPGRADLLASKGPQAVTQVASATPTLGAAPMPLGSRPAAPQATLPTQPQLVTPAAAAPQAQPAVIAPVQQASVQPAAEPVMSGNDKFRWPASGRIITDFAGSKGTGINIEVAEGSPVKAAENGTVIYVGSGVEGYGNLILLRHPNGFVSAYAHLKSMSVVKGATVNRGDGIGTAGMTGSVSKPQLHFELRKGATPVDPVPLLAS